MRTYKLKTRGNKQLFIILGLLAVSLTMSCKKFLDAKPNDKLNTPETPADLQAMLDNAGIMNNKSPTYDEVSADDYFLTSENYALLALRGQAAYLWEPWPNEHPNEWGRAAEIIYATNVCLEAAEKQINGGTPAKDLANIQGSALFYRAFTWLRQLWVYSQAYDDATAKADLGIVIRKTADFNVPSERSNVEDCYAQILADLLQAVELLPDRPEHVLRPSKAAAYGLLARAYLSMRKYDLALANAEKCLAIKSDLIDYNTINAAANSPFQSYNTEVIFHADVVTFSYGNLFITSGMVDTLLYQSYNTNDLRKSVYYAATGKYNYFKGTYISRAVGGNTLFMGLATDEIYLMKAECFARLGKTDQAMETLNLLMKKRWKNAVPYPTLTAANQATALDIILKERRKELLFRGLRWMDIKRLNKEGYQIGIKRILGGKTYTLAPNSERFALPIPIDIIKIGGIPQNPGW